MSPLASVLSEVKESLLQFLITSRWPARKKIQNKKSPLALSRKFTLTH